MEGPSILLCSQQLAPLIDHEVIKISGNTKIDKDRMLHKKIVDIFSWGKHLVIQFDHFALRIHFMLFGSYQASINKIKYPGRLKHKKNPRLVLKFKNGFLKLFNCSLKFIELKNAKENYDFTTDLMSDFWDEKNALKKVVKKGNLQIADVLLDQEIFSGLGNIMKNEILFLEKILPDKCIEQIPISKLKKLIKTARKYAFQFYEWKKQFILRKNYRIYKKPTCPICKTKPIRKITGQKERLSYYCQECQK